MKVSWFMPFLITAVCMDFEPQSHAGTGKQKVTKAENWCGLSVLDQHFLMGLQITYGRY